ncbi:MAG: MATE family efflux transporter [Ruminococcaceae bacterium]|nr:MATE family efflux transporter [Oscillospiraceae bacterium]
MFGRKNIDATKGPILRLIILYCIPLIIGTLIQTLFNAVDVAILGNMADSTSVASVGATTAIFHLLVHGFVGIASGLKILLARYIGAQDSKRILDSVGTSLIFSLVFGIIIAVLGFFLSPVFLNLTKCPADCYDGAVLYLQIYLTAAPAILLYNFGSSVITANGDTQRPLYYMLSGGVLNLVLNIILCLILPQKVVAVAVATAVSQVFSAVLTIRRVFKIYDLNLKNIPFSFTSLSEMLRFGIPLAITNTLYPLANLQIQSAINSFGSAAVAGSSAATNLEGIASAFTSSFATATSVFISQNIGANLPDRVKKSFFHNLWLGISSGILIGGFLYLTGEFWLSILLGSDSTEAVEFGMIRLFFVTLMYFIAATNGVLSNAIQSFGYPIVSSISSIFCILVFRIIWMNFIYPVFPNFHCLNACFTVSWILLLLCNIVFATIFFKRYLKGKYKHL